MSFIDNPTLPFPKFELNPFAGDPAKAVSNTDWNAVCQALLDLRAAVTGSPGRTLFALWTDSNGMGPPTDINQDDPADRVSIPNNHVVETKLYTTGFAEPVTPIIMGTGPLRIQGSSPAHGPELAFGRALDEILNGPGASPDAAHKVWISQYSIHSSLLSQWQQGSTAGTLSPLLGGGNLDANSSAKASTASAASGRTLACAVTMLGTNDGSDTTAASNAATNVTAFMTRKRAVHGAQLLFVWVVPQSTIPGGTYPFAATARANIITALTAATGVAIVYAEDLPTSDDLVHFVSIAEQVLGWREGFAYVRLAGLIERVVTSATVVGYSPATYNGSAHGLCGFSGAPGSNLRAWPWQGSADGDVMFVPVFKGTIGAGSAIATPSGWTQAIQVTNTDVATVENRAALFWKNCAQAELDTNVPSTGGPGFPITLTIAPGGAQFSLKPFTIRGAGRFPVVGTPVGFTHTTLDTSAVTAGGVTVTAGQKVFIMVFCWNSGGSLGGQTFSIVNANFSSIVQVYGAAYPSSSGNYLFMGLWECTPVGPGASGNSTVTPSIAASSCGFTWAM